ncbi:uncharacterized protein LOC118750665 [Rhagoletis pomonella]|uniref:uncharacterized protein LOC118750661 n=1 Tax=Rhagoletis pomonella TaxID=28610 RepID=UPI001786AB3A|nr:uncharacterized protein LOC118750661 [Rhagoletis pomonella]XP_036341291.1 uncharacterized protein LOC118750665 [Rhagoletis pomonella]
MEKEMFNPTSSIVTALCSYLLEKPILFPAADLPKNVFSFIRVHREKLEPHGEFSFPCSLDLWKNCCKETGYKIREVAFAMFTEGEEDTSNAAKQKFLNAAACWEFPIERIRIDKERCFLFLQRRVAMGMLLREVLKEKTHTRRYGNLKKDPNLCVLISSTKQPEEEVKELSFYRAKLLEAILRRVLEYSQWTVVTEEDGIDAKKGNGPSVLQLTVTSTAGKPLPHPTVIPPSKLRYATIRSGLVIDPLTGKMTKLKTSEYLSCRSNDMCLMAMHKYGVRVKDDSRFNALLTRLGAAAVTVDLMEVRFSSPVQIIRSGKGSTKGAAFILYNSARLESLLRRFDEKVENGDYGDLPSLDNIDWTLLDEEEEWQLVFSYIFAFPNLIENCLERIEKGICAVHTIIRFLGDLASLFSVYYRRIRILTQETREHLLPCVYARIYLVKAVREILNRTLALLDIEPVQFM